MRKLFLIVILFQSIIYANDTDLILNEIKQLRFDMNKRFEAVDKRFEQVDKRFEQVDKRFEAMQSNMDKRFETVFTILYILMGLVFASPFIAIYLRDKKEIEDKKNFDIIKGILFVLKEFAQDNEKVAKSLRSAGLM
jgi:tetrahydromethanopterin S-methyltransferase subunit G